MANTTPGASLFPVDWRLPPIGDTFGDTGPRRRQDSDQNLGAVSTRRDGRVVDGGGLEKRIGRFVEFANFFVKSARSVR